MVRTLRVRACERQVLDASLWRQRLSDEDNGRIRQFETGATRDTAQNKIDPEGFLAPEVIALFSEYMHRHRFQSDGTMRDSDNWQKGIPVDAYMKSMWRHFLDLWLLHRGAPPVSPDHAQIGDLEAMKREILCALLFHVQGMLFESLRGRDE